MTGETGWSTGGKRLVLTVTTGRSGTNYLHHLLQDLPGLLCLHEPAPDFLGAMRAAQTDTAVAEAFLLDKKLPFVRAQAGSIYLETGHLACKGFIEPLIRHGIVPDLIILTRDKIKVASSLYMLNTIPGRNEAGLRYLLSPGDPNVVAIDGWPELHDWSLCYWYCLEIERRAAVYKAILDGIGGLTFTTSIEALKQPGATRPLVRFVYRGHERLMPNFPIPETRIGRLLNAKPGLKRKDADPGLTPAAMLEMAAAVEAAFKVSLSRQTA